MPLSSFAYRRRVMGALIAVLTMAVLLVWGWPLPTPSPPSDLFRDAPREHIQIQDVRPTTQSPERSPVPPAPPPPVVVPNDVLIEEPLPFGDAELTIDTPGRDATRSAGPDRPTTARRPDVEARLLKTVQPTYPAAARTSKVRARIEVEVRVGADGTVETATVQRRWRLSGDGPARPVSQLGYGLEAAALDAARRAQFRPARAGGRPVPTRTTLTYTFGPE